MTRSRQARPEPVRAAQIENLESRKLLSASPLQGLNQGPNEVQSIDGTGNNESSPELGSTGQTLVRLADANYADGVGEPNDDGLPSAREVSNIVSDQEELVDNSRYLTDITWLWGQFLDHDIDLSLTTGETGEPESFDIEVPTGDPEFDPFGTGAQTISLTRSEYDDSTGVYEQINAITAFIDGSNVYGSDAERADALRTFEGGKLKTSDGDLLPFNEEGLENAGGTSEELFLAGDIRANENVALTSMHTIFVREHNRLADEIAAKDPTLSDEEIYQEARSINIAQMQAITYNEFLPALLGYDALSDYEGYDPTVNPNIANEFSTAAYRLGHSLLSPELERIGADGEVVEDGNLALRDAFFNPSEVVENGIDDILRGATVGLAQELDAQVIDDVRNFLFGPPGAGGLDLAALNIQRGRDHGLSSYNDTRAALGLPRAESFADITSDPALQAKLEEAYGEVDSIDLWVGLLSEDHLSNSSVGETMQLIIAQQFEALRDGDRFYYENVFSGRQLRQIENTSLGDIIERNTEIEGLQDNVFFDAGVVIYELQSGRRANEVSVEITDSEVIIQNGRRSETHSRDGLKQVMIVGADGTTDTVSLRIRGDAAPLEGGVVLVGGEGGRDTLRVVNTSGGDRVDVAGDVVTFNGHTIETSGLEILDARSLRRGDDVTVSEETDIRVVEGRRDGMPGRDGRRDNDERRRVPTSETEDDDLFASVAQNLVSELSGGGSQTAGRRGR